MEKPLAIFPKSAAFVKPSESAFHNPTLRKNHESMKLIALNDLHFRAGNGFDCILEVWGSDAPPRSRSPSCRTPTGRSFSSPVRPFRRAFGVSSRVADWLRCSSIGGAGGFTSWTGVGIVSRVGSGMGAVSAGTAASMIGVVSMFSRPGVAIGRSTVGGVVSAQSGARASAFSGAASAKTPKKTRGKR